ISAILGFIGISIVDPLKNTDISAIKSIMTEAAVDPEAEDVTFLGQLVQAFTVPDFQMLFSKNNMLQLIVFSILFGLATAM
ncbi:cation:dicarboxylase symporter family transporter, partial [Escherichia coli]|nr:cation:dicarboxylase symporter family transporter [Escherichia coli]